MMYAATLAGISFGNAGVHVPHGMSYSVAGMIKDYYPEGWPKDHSMCPHGISVVVNAPAAFRFTGQALPERHWQAAQALGVPRRVILYRHILPHVMHIILISVVLDFSSLVLAEAVLSYVNIGVDPTTYSWGNMINQARLEMAREPMVWWSLFSAFIFMFILVLAANLFSDRIQRVLDPRNDT